MTNLFSEAFRIIGKNEPYREQDKKLHDLFKGRLRGFSRCSNTDLFAYPHRSFEQRTIFLDSLREGNYNSMLVFSFDPFYMDYDKGIFEEKSAEKFDNLCGKYRMKSWIEVPDEIERNVFGIPKIEEGVPSGLLLKYNRRRGASLGLNNQDLTALCTQETIDLITDEIIGPKEMESLNDFFSDLYYRTSPDTEMEVKRFLDSLNLDKK